jgi:hypothetical protein
MQNSPKYWSTRVWAEIEECAVIQERGVIEKRPAIEERTSTKNTCRRRTGSN